jgi:hypothetical protein
MSRSWLKANVSHQSSGFWKNSATMERESVAVHVAALLYQIHEYESGAIDGVKWQGATELRGKQPYPRATSSTINPKLTALHSLITEVIPPKLNLRQLMYVCNCVCVCVCLINCCSCEIHRMLIYWGKITTMATSVLFRPLRVLCLVFTNIYIYTHIYI